MIAYSFRRLRPRLVTVAAMKWMKWMKWIGRSPVERAAATALPTCVDAVRSGQQIAAQLSAVIGQSNLTA